MHAGGEVCGRGACPSSVPISCELPQMKGRNWKSSRPHTPWLPAGSILYVFWSFRITSRYLHRRVGKRGEAAKVKGQSQPFCHWERREARNNRLRLQLVSISVKSCTSHDQLILSK